MSHQHSIKLNSTLLSHPHCNNCGSDKEVKVFQLSTDPMGTNRQVMAWCPRCAREIINTLGSAFPEPLPLWVKAMQNL